MVKTYYLFDKDGKVEDKINFTYNFRTPILYMNYTGRDIIADFNKTLAANSHVLPKLRPETIQKLQNINDVGKFDISDFTEEELDILVSQINTSETNEFLTNYVKVLYATTIYPQKLEWAEIDDYIPPHILSDRDFVQELYGLMVFGMPDYKKKLV